MMGAAAGADPLATVEGVYQAARRNVRGPDQSGVGAAAAGFTWDGGPRRSCDPVGAILVYTGVSGGMWHLSRYYSMP